MRSSPERPRVAISAASSFTGTWIARAFHKAGWTVLPVCSRPAAAYSGVRRARIRFVQECAPVHFGGEAEDGRMAAWIKKHRPHIWIHHHHFMENFRSPDYDIERALRIGLGSLPGILEAVASGGGVGVVYSGTYFEPGEWGQVWQAAAPSPYALSKALLWDALCLECELRGLATSKIVIPNPVGPLENEDRLIPCMIRHAEAGSALHLRAPGQIVDNLPVEDIAAHYVLAATRLLNRRAAAVIRPSGRISTALDWVQFAGAELVERRLGLPLCKLRYDRLPARARADSPADAGATNWSDASDWTKAWDFYALRLRRGKTGVHPYPVEKVRRRIAIALGCPS